APVPRVRQARRALAGRARATVPAGRARVRGTHDFKLSRTAYRRPGAELPRRDGGTVKSRLALLAVLLGVVAFAGAGPAVGAPPPTQCAPAADDPAATTADGFLST